MNVAPTAAIQPVPKVAVYAATKALLPSLGQAVDVECRLRGVQVMTFCPSATATGFEAASGAPSRWVRNAPTADAVVAKGLRAIEAGDRLDTANMGKAIMANATRLLPRRWVVAAAKSMVG